MPVKRYGIYLFYGPTVDLHKEGLGRLLAGFLKGVAEKKDVRFVIACPEWSRQSFDAFCRNERIPTGNLDVVSTGSVPFLLRAFLAQRDTPESSAAARAAEPNGVAVRLRGAVERRLASARNPLAFALVALAAALGGALAVVAVALRQTRAFAGWLVRGLTLGVNSLLTRPGEDPFEVRLYRAMESAEADRLLARIAALRDIRAWYSPTAFWPDFHRVPGPRLMCVPDVFMREFPVDFARLEPELAINFRTVERSIREGTHFVTYSAQVKWRTVVERYGRPPENVSVVHHAAWDLTGWLVRDPAERRALLAGAMRRRGAIAEADATAAGALPYFFYASQFRPNKNLLTLLRAFERLRDRGLPHKLILTGDPKRYPAVAAFLRERRLQNDVHCLHGLTMQELASFYGSADLALNPSLSEGGCPFTLTEALSVDTPIIMARIPVTEEILDVPALKSAMLFDPYDFRDLAARIGWALEHRGELLAAQRELYARMRRRTWEHVVDDYVAIMERIREGAGA